MQSPGKPRPPLVAYILIFLQTFLGLNGLAGGGAFILAPDGSLLKMPFSHLKNTPFSSFLIPGVLLLLFLGVYPLGVAYSLWKRPGWRWPAALNPFKGIHWSWADSLAAGVIALVWITVQIQWIQPGFLHAFIFGWGILILIVTLLPGVRQYYKRES
jgi:hypothetical protein